MGITLVFLNKFRKVPFEKERLQIYVKGSAIVDEINFMSFIDISSSSLDIFGEKLSIVLMTLIFLRLSLKDVLGEQMILASLLPICIKCSLHLFAIVSSFISFPCISSPEMFV